MLLCGGRLCNHYGSASVHLTALVSDLQFGLLPGLSFNKSLAYDLLYLRTEAYKPAVIARPTTWLRDPSAYPAFAEFSEPLEVPADVDDTGTLFRASLPFANAQSRETLSNYSGDALVLDARVSCQRPRLSDIIVTYDVYGFAYISGTFMPTAKVQRLSVGDPSMNFSCGMSLIEDFVGISICRTNGSANFLVDDFNFTESRTSLYDDLPAPTYLIINSTQTN